MIRRLFASAMQGKTTFSPMDFSGEVAEWSNASALKADVLKGTVGSNPTLSEKTA